jgi:transcription elongation factor Elf1
MEGRPTVAKCYRCGSAKISEFYEEEEGTVIVCAHCGHRVVEAYETATKCPRCGNAEAVDSYDKTDGVVLECSCCGHRECSGWLLIEDKYTKCPQCGNAEAHEIYDENESGRVFWCERCGRHEFTGPVFFENTDYCGWKNEIEYGAGFMEYRKGDKTYARFLHTAEQVACAEEELREKLLSGEYEANGMFLTRWNPEMKQVELVLGDIPTQDTGPEAGAVLDAPPS